MPDERFIHRRQGMDATLCRLTDFEFRVLEQYRLSADDCGVMPMTAAKLQAENYNLADRPAHLITAALKQLVAVGLLAAFEHQGRAYICQLDWQDLQKVRYPRDSHLPMPPAEILARCSGKTAALFQVRLCDRGEILQSHHHNGSERTPNDYGNISETSPTPARGGDRAKRLTANGKQLTAEGEEPEVCRFPLLGGHMWALGLRQFEAWQQTYPRLDLLTECRSAASWLAANPGRMKTAKGMPRFLDQWFKRATRALPIARSVEVPTSELLGVDAAVVDVCERAGIGTHDIGTWFRGVTCERRHDGQIVLLVPELEARTWIQRHYAEKLARVHEQPIEILGAA